MTKKALQMLQNHPYTYTIFLCILMLLLLQRPFMATGDSWAESWYEYVHGALVGGSGVFFHIGIAGYFNFLPKLLSYPYILLGLPLEYIDYFFRYMVVGFVVACAAFVAHKYNRALIRSDLIRALLAVGIVLCFNHVSSLNMINAWYAGFLPIILISISPHKFSSEIKMVLYAAYALAVTLSKPSIILLPATIYRTLRHREYLLGFITTFGIVLQTMLFFTSGYLSSIPPITATLLSRGLNTLLYPGLLLFKQFGITPPSVIAVGIASLTIVALAYVAFRRIGFFATAILLVVMVGASYTSLYAPDAPAPSVFKHYDALFANDMKLQREIMIRMLLLIFIFIPFDIVLERFGKKQTSCHPPHILNTLSS